MREHNYDAFVALIDDVAALLLPGQPLGATARAMYFRALRAYSLEDVRAALDAHVKDPQRGRFFPKPADVIAQLMGLAENDGRPGAEEAWSIALRSDDEAASVVWTEEIAQAMGVAQPVLRNRDKVGARMAFREAYERMVEEARAERRPVRWMASEGHDPRQRADAIRQAVELGRLPASDLERLPAPDTGGLFLAMARSDGQTAASGRAAFQALHDRLSARREDEYEPGLDALQKAETRRLQAELQERLQKAQAQ